MRTKFIFAGLSIALLTTPLLASASTLSDLQAQLTSILAHIRMLEMQIGTSDGTSAGAGGSGSVSVGSGGGAGAPCPVIDRSLSEGASGADVSSLQQYLNAHGYLGVSATGYYGPLTAAAVGKWQAASDVATAGTAGFGIFGPRSRAAFFRNCGGGKSAQTFSADTLSGAAPLSVTFTTSDSIASTATYSVDFGDGSQSSMEKGSCVGIAAVVGGEGGIRCSYSASHVYSANGTYTARLMKDTCPAGAQCFVGPLPVGTLTITVGSSATSSLQFSASPSAGAAPLSVQFTATAPQGTTLGTTVYFGDGTSGSLRFVPVCSNCSAEAVASHTYASPGTYTATLTSGTCACPAGGICNCPNMPILATATVTAGASGAASSTIQQLNAPGSVTLLAPGGIAEVRNESMYFTLESVTASTATIQPTPVGCWNSFPSDTPPQIRCMIAVIPIPPQTLSLGERYAGGQYGITLTGIADGRATFSVDASSTAQ